MIENIISDIDTVLQDVNTEMNLVYEALEQLREIMALENNGTTSRLVDFFRFCSDAKTSVGSFVTNSTSTLSEITLLPSTEPSTILSPSGESSITLSIPSGTLIGLSAEATSTSSTIVMALDSSTLANNFTKSKLNHSLATMIPSPTESYISDEAASSIEYDSLPLDGDYVEVTSFMDLSQEKNIFPWLNVTNLKECDGAERQFKKYIDDVIIGPYGHIKRDQKFFNLAEMFNDIYVFTEYNECFALIEEGKKNLDYFWTILDLINNVTRGYLVDMKKLTPVKIFQFPKSVDNFDAKLQEVCRSWWEFMYITQASFVFSKVNIRMAPKELSEVNNTISEWRHILENIAVENPFPTENIEQYLAKDITKQELAKQFLSIQNATKRERYFQGVQNMDFLMHKYRKRVAEAVEYILELYLSLTQRMDDNTMQHLEIVRKFKTVDLDFENVENEFYKAMEENNKKLAQDITNPLFDMLFKIKTMETNLREYNDSIKMDSQFYL